MNKIKWALLVLTALSIAADALIYLARHGHSDAVLAVLMMLYVSVLVAAWVCIIRTIFKS